MSADLLLGLDSGSTMTKAVLFRTDGSIAGVGSVAVPQHAPQPHHVERDMVESWEAAAGAIRAALQAAGVTGDAVAAVGVTAHGDGVYLLDRSGAPLGRGMMSLDSRAFSLHAGWAANGTLDRMLPLSGQRPYPYSAVALLAWVRDNQPERYAAIGHVLFCKDWLRYRLTGEIATDLTEASTGFTDLHTQDRSDEILRLLGLTEMASRLPAILLPTDRAGTITAEAARATGLRPGTPVAAGLHDVISSAVGLGNVRPGDLTMTAGTFSINEVLWDAPRCSPDWSCRAGFRRGLWNAMSISPASSANLEWLTGICAPGLRSSEALAALEAAIDQAFNGEQKLTYHPFLYGSPYEAPASGGFFGLRSWHKPAHLVRAVLEGIVFNHRVHVDALAAGFAIRTVGISGGGSHLPKVSQLFADGLDRAVRVPDVADACALGAALCGGVAAGMFRRLEEAAAAAAQPARDHPPDPGRSPMLARSYSRYTRLVEAMRPLWPDLYEDEAAQTEVSA